MKKQKGITLMSLALYVIVMIIVLVVMTSIINEFYKNSDTVKGNVKEIVKFNKFNSYFLKEIKTENNSVDSISENYILFSSGNSFSIFDEKLYYNNIEICDGVEKIEFKLGKDGDGIDESIIYVTASFESFNKSINYKIEKIY